MSPKDFKYSGGVRVGSRIDLKNKDVWNVFRGEVEVMLIYKERKLIFFLCPRSKMIRDRIEFLANDLINGNPITTGNLFSGVGCGDIGLESGFNLAGLSSQCRFVNEIESKFIDCYTSNNPTYRPGDTVTAALDIHQLFPKALPKVHLWSATIVCKPYSKLNVQKRDAPERDHNYGHLTTSTLMTLQMTEFASPFIFIEQVACFFESISFQHLKRILELKGYVMLLAGDFSDTGRYQGVASGDYGSVENRRRLLCCFVSEGINIDLSYMNEMARSNHLPLSAYLDEPSTIPDSAFNIGASLKVKALNSDWKNCVVKSTDTRVSTISAGMARVRCEDPKLLRDDNDPLGDFRLFTHSEVARFKQLPDNLVDGVKAKKDQIEMLGNGLDGGASTAFFYAIAKSLTTLPQPWNKIGKNRNTD